jgi:hypothetical protein
LGKNIVVKGDKVQKKMAAEEEHDKSLDLNEFIHLNLAKVQGEQSNKLQMFSKRTKN